MEPGEEARTSRLALLVAAACVLQIAESMLPHPLPGLRLGLANTLTLIALATFGFKYALQITILRTLLSSFLIGTFMSPGFILSFSAGIASTLVMGAVYWAAHSQRHFRLSIVGVSVVGALAHNTVQLLLAYVLLVRHPGIFVFFPWLMIGAVVTGWVTGIVAGNVCRRLAEGIPGEAETRTLPAGTAPQVPRDYLPGDGLLHRIPPSVKVGTLVVLAVVVLVFANPWLYGGILVALVTAGVLSGVSPFFVLSKIRRYILLLGMAFLLPLFFNAGADVLVSAGPFRVTTEGLILGGVLATRILLLMTASVLLVRTTSPEGMTQGLTKCLSPLGLCGISVASLSGVLSEAWLAIPAYWETVVRRIRVTDLRELRRIRDVVPLLTDLIVGLYLDTAQVGTRVDDGRRRGPWLETHEIKGRGDSAEKGAEPVGSRAGASAQTEADSTRR